MRAPPPVKWWTVCVVHMFFSFFCFSCGHKKRPSVVCCASFLVCCLSSIVRRPSSVRRPSLLARCSSLLVHVASLVPQSPFLVCSSRGISCVCLFSHRRQSARRESNKTRACATDPCLWWQQLHETDSKVFLHSSTCAAVPSLLCGL
jgi:hypothetical protein